MKINLKITLIISAIALTLGVFILPQNGQAVSHNLIKIQCTTENQSICKAVYYLHPDGKRYVFPNQKTYFTWYDGFSLVKDISASEMASYQIGGNVRYRPGLRLIKIATDPKVYAVSRFGVLRWIETETAAKDLYGDTWPAIVEDVPATFFADYTIGSSIASSSDYNPQTVRDSVDFIEENSGQAPPVEVEKTCTSNPNPVFTRHITDTSLIRMITPPGGTVSGGIVKYHSFIWIADRGSRVPVYAPVDMTLTNGAHYLEELEANFILNFDVSCEVTLKLDHIKDPVQSIRDVFPIIPRPTNDTRGEQVTPVEFRAGDLIGYTTGTVTAYNWDLGVYGQGSDLDENALCPYDLFSSGLQTAYRNIFGSPQGELGTNIPTTICN